MNDDDIRRAVQKHSQDSYEFRNRIRTAAYNGSMAALEMLIQRAVEYIGYKVGQLAESTIRRIGDWIKANW